MNGQGMKQILLKNQSEVDMNTTIGSLIAVLVSRNNVMILLGGNPYVEWN